MTTTSNTESDLQAFGQAYQYNVDYLLELNRAAPQAFEHFAASQALGHYRVELSLEAHFVARIVCMQVEDCGACAQLSLRMAVEAGVSRSLLETLLHRPDELPPLLASVRDHVRRVLGVDAMDEDAAVALRSELGDAGFAELATCIVGCCIYPTLKKAMLATQTCQALHLDF